MRIDLTMMCMVYDKDKILVMNRAENDWPGLTFPGGHVEANESMEQCCIREVKEETGLELTNLECVGHIEWLGLTKGVRYLAILYRSNEFKGEIISSNEGEIFWCDKDKINDYPFSNDFDKILELCTKGLYK